MAEEGSVGALRAPPSRGGQPGTIRSGGARLTRQTFGEARERGGTVIIHGRTEEMTRIAVGHPRGGHDRTPGVGLRAPRR